MTASYKWADKTYDKGGAKSPISSNDFGCFLVWKIAHLSAPHFIDQNHWLIEIKVLHGFDSSLCYLAANMYGRFVSNERNLATQ